MFSANSHRLLLGFSLLAHIGLAIGYTVVLPPLNWPDEPAHLNYAAALMRGEGLETMKPEVWAPDTLPDLVEQHFLSIENPLKDQRVSAIRYQAHQPPLFYGLSALVLGTQVGGADANGLLRVRCVNLALSCGSLLLVFAFLKCVSGRHDIAAIGVGFLAVLPTRSFMAVSIGNDVAIEFWFALFSLLLVSAGGRGSNPSEKVRVSIARWRRPVVLGIVFGLGMLTKATAVLMLVLQAAWFRPSTRGARYLGWTAAVGALIAGPWLLRNMLIYGPLDPLAIKAGAWGFADSAGSLAALSRPTLELSGEYGLSTFFGTLFLSFWGVFGWMEMVPGKGLQFLYLLLTMTAVVGVTRTLAQERAPAGVPQGRGSLRAALCWSLVAVSVGVASIIVYSRVDYQPQGRYLLPLSAPIALLFAVGWLRALPRYGVLVASGGVVALALANIYGLLYVIPWYLS